MPDPFFGGGVVST